MKEEPAQGEGGTSKVVLDWGTIPLITTHRCSQQDTGRGHCWQWNWKAKVWLQKCPGRGGNGGRMTFAEAESRTKDSGAAQTAKSHSTWPSSGSQAGTVPASRDCATRGSPVQCASHISSNGGRKTLSLKPVPRQLPGRGGGAGEEGGFRPNTPAFLPFPPPAHAPWLVLT